AISSPGTRSDTEEDADVEKGRSAFPVDVAIREHRGASPSTPCRSSNPCSAANAIRRADQPRGCQEGRRRGCSRSPVRSASVARGKLVGASGASGGTAQQDGQVAKAGADAIK